MDFVPVLAMLTLIIAIINLVKYVKARDTNGIVTTLSVWVAGVVVVLLVGQTDFADGIVVADRALADYNTWSLVFIGLTVASMAQFANEIKTALDSGDTAAKPPLV
jgi:predicted lactoylglutathione lyase